MSQLNVSCTYLISLQHIREIGGDGFEGLFVPSVAKQTLIPPTLCARLSLL